MGRARLDGPGLRPVGQRCVAAAPLHAGAGVGQVCGRLVLNVWRSARAELKLTSYTLDNVAAKLLAAVISETLRCRLSNL